jgi:hypothetical protein
MIAKITMIRVVVGFLKKNSWKITQKELGEKINSTRKRDVLYGLFMNLRYNNLPNIVTGLRNLGIKPIFVGHAVQDDGPCTFSFVPPTRNGRICPICGYNDPSYGATRCPSCS